MIFNRNKAGFSLTELLIVLAIISVLLAVGAPILVKSKVKTDAVANESVWDYVNGTTQGDSFYDPGIPGWSSSLIIGYIPAYNVDNATPSKVIIKSSNKSKSHSQSAIQFRYGEDKGAATGVLYANDFGEYYLTTGGVGYNPLSSSGNLTGVYSNNTVLGKLTNRFADFSDFDINSAGEPDDNVFIGGTSSPDTRYISKNVIARLFDSSDVTALRSGSVHIGSGYGNVSFSDKNFVMNPSSVYVGYQPVFDKVNAEYKNNLLNGVGYGYNTIIGYNTSFGYNISNTYAYYPTTKSPYKNMTAIGYNACKNVLLNNPDSDISLTCIGDGVTGTDSRFTSHIYYPGDYVFIGQQSTFGDMDNGLGNHSVLEIYNPVASSDTNPNSSNTSTSVVLNSNLVVKGLLYANTKEGTSELESAVALQNGGWINRPSEDIVLENLTRRTDEAYPTSVGWYDLTVHHSGPGRNTLFGTQKKERTPLSASMLYNDNYRTWGDCTPDKMFKSDSAYLNCLKNNEKVSDIRLKDNITPNNDGLEKILELTPYNYTYKTDPSQTVHTGVIAQSLMKVFPNAVTKDESGFYVIRWDEMFFALINSIKQLNAKVQKISSDIAQMTKDIKIIKNGHTDVKKQISVLNSRVNKLERGTRR